MCVCGSYIAEGALVCWVHQGTDVRGSHGIRQQIALQSYSVKMPLKSYLLASLHV